MKSQRVTSNKLQYLILDQANDDINWSAIFATTQKVFRLKNYHNYHLHTQYTRIIGIS